MKLELLGNLNDASERINIIVSEMYPQEKCKIELTITYSWCTTKMYGTAMYMADENGIVDLEKTVPIDKKYKSANSMGMFAILDEQWCKFKAKPDRNYAREYVICTFSAICASEKVEKTINRKFADENVDCMESEKGRYFYHVDNNKRNKILLLGGSEASMNAVSPLAASLTRQGSDVLLLHYYGKRKWMPVKLEMVEEAIQWLKNDDAKQISIIGMSKGAELALLSGTTLRGIDKVVAIAPSEYVYQCPWGLLSSWSYQGKCFPCVYIGILGIVDFYKNILFKLFRLPTGYLFAYVVGTAIAPFKEKKRIKVEKIDVPLCMVAGAKDSLWQSKNAIEHIQKQRKNALDEAYIYENCGHSFQMPFIFGNSKEYGGTALDNMNASEDAWKKINEFLQRT